MMVEIRDEKVIVLSEWLPDDKIIPYDRVFFFLASDFTMMIYPDHGLSWKNSWRVWIVEKNQPQGIEHDWLMRWCFAMPGFFFASWTRGLCQLCCLK